MDFIIKKMTVKDSREIKKRFEKAKKSNKRLWWIDNKN